MGCELDPQLRTRAERILQTDSKLVGERYWRSGLKRGLDLLIASPSSVVALPIIAAAGVAILAQDGHWPFVKLHSPHPGAGFVPVYKLRTMIPGAHLQEIDLTKGTTLNKLKREGNDPRVTRIGRLLRKSTVDELPQLFNVIAGNLSVVGPRPLSLSDWQFVDSHRGEEPFRGFVALLERGHRYGLSGFLAIFGRADLEITDRFQLDVMYGQQASLKADLKILALTAPAVLKAKGAY